MLYKMELTKYLKKCSATFFLILAADSCIALATDEKMENILLYTAMILFLIPIADLLFNHRLTESKKTNGMLSNKMRLYILTLSVGCCLITTSYFLGKK
jgi:Mn2+/Fe2+ NRAMP family transporter